MMPRTPMGYILAGAAIALLINAFVDWPSGAGGGKK